MNDNILDRAPGTERPARPRADPGPALVARLAATPGDVAQALALRAMVFVEELGATPQASVGRPPAARESDRYDDFADHLIVEDLRRPHGSRVIGTTRVLDGRAAARAGGFYSAQEFDLAPLMAGGHSLIEVGRTCLHPDYRGGSAMVVLWQALAELVAARCGTLLFGVASFPGACGDVHARALDELHRASLAPPPLRVRSRQGGWRGSNFAEASASGRLEAMRATPALVKSYLRLGAVIGDGVFVDHAFNTTDICILLEARRFAGAAARLYAGPARRPRG